MGRNLPEVEYVPSDRENKAIRQYADRDKLQPAVPALKVIQEADGPRLVYDHPDQGVATILVATALGCVASGMFAMSIVDEINRLTSNVDGTPDAYAANCVLGFMTAMQPRDEAEAMLLLQQAVTHRLSLKMARRVQMSGDIQQTEAFERMYTRLARTNAAQLEALKRYRTGGEQKVSVTHQHVNVSDGGQAIVGPVSYVPKPNSRKPGPAAPVQIAAGTTMPMEMIVDPVSEGGRG